MQVRNAKPTPHLHVHGLRSRKEGIEEGIEYMDRYQYLKPGEILHVFFKGRTRVRSYDPSQTVETVQTVVIMDGRLVLGKPRRFSAKEVRILSGRGSRSLLEGFKSKMED
jgi:hypothetical protein